MPHRRLGETGSRPDHDVVAFAGGQRPSGGMAGENEPRELARLLEAADVIVEHRLRRRRLHPRHRGLPRRRPLDDRVRVLCHPSERRDAMPAAARQDQINQGFEVDPVEARDQRLARRDQRPPCLQGRVDDRLRLAGELAPEIALRFRIDRAQRLPIGADLGQLRAQGVHQQRTPAHVGIAPRPERAAEADAVRLSLGLGGLAQPGDGRVGVRLAEALETPVREFLMPMASTLTRSAKLCSRRSAPPRAR